jgi:transposase
MQTAADRPEAPTAIRTDLGDGRLLPDHLKAQVCRELDRLELLLEEIKAVEAERDVLLAAQQAPAAMLLDIKGPGRFLCGPGADTLAERIGRSRTLMSFARSA